MQPAPTNNRDPLDPMDALDPFDHSFVDAVLQLRGVDEQPTFDQFKDALRTLGAYYTALMQAPPTSDPVDDDWLDGHTIDSAAFQLAFLFSQFGVLYVSQATAEQMEAWNYWWRTGEVPVYRQPTSAVVADAEGASH